MTQKSLYGGIFKGMPATAIAASGLPMRTSTSKLLANNINYIADSRSQVIASWCSKGGVGTTGLISIDASPSSRGVISTIRYNARVDENGVPYSLRVFLAGWSSKGDIAALRIRVSGITATYTTDTFTDQNDVWRTFQTGAHKEQMIDFTEPQPVYDEMSFDASNGLIPTLVTTTPITIWIEDAACTGVAATLQYVTLSQYVITEYCKPAP